jgi:iron(III) transport system permease protein
VQLQRIFALSRVFPVISALVSAAVVIPVFYLVSKAFQADYQTIVGLVWRWRTLELLTNTALLTTGVLALTTAIALPLAWLLTRTDIKFKPAFTLLSVLPLAIPGYMLAYTLMGLSGANGVLATVFGINVPRLSGYFGALISISLYTYPYMFLNLKAALSGLDPSLEDAARSMGLNTKGVLRHVVIPQLKPAFWAGSLIIGLYVLGDFGAVSLMRFETFSYALFLQYTSSYDRIYAAWIAIMMLTITGTILIIEYKLLRGIKLHRTGSGVSRIGHLSKLGFWSTPIYSGLFILAFFSLFVPVATILFWLNSFHLGGITLGLTSALKSSLTVSVPSAILAALFALPLAYMSVRYPSIMSKLFERLAWLGYSIPPLALALAFVFFSLSAVPWLYQTLILLIFAYSVHFLAEALGPIRSALLQASPKLEEAARSLGATQWAAFRKITFPLLNQGLIAGAAFVFLSCMKELPMAFILSPIGFETLAVNVWSYTNEAMFSHAAPYALTILVFSSVFVGALFSREWRGR